MASYSKRYIFVLSEKNPYNLRTLGWLVNNCIFIYWVTWASIPASLTSFLLIILIAKTKPVLRSRAMYTSPNLPFPNFLPTSNWVSESYSPSLGASIALKSRRDWFVFYLRFFRLCCSGAYNFLSALFLCAIFMCQSWFYFYSVCLVLVLYELIMVGLVLPIAFCFIFLTLTAVFF